MAITVDVTPNNTTVSPEESVTTTLDITTSIPTISAFLPLLSVSDAGGDGSLAYNSSNGEFTYTGPSASEVRAHLSAGTGVTYSSGQFSIGQDVSTTANTNFQSVTISSFLDVNGSADISGSITGVDTLTATLVNATMLVGNTIAGSSLDINGDADISGNLTGVDTLTASGEIEGGSLDINGDADISGNLTGVDTLTASGEIEGGSLDINGDADISGTATAAEFVGDLRGAVRFQAKAGESLTKGNVVYISGISGQKPVVSKARANSATTMPAFGLANATVNNNANLEVISFGTFAHGDTTGGAENWEVGDVLYVSAATAGALTNVKPAGAANLIQNVGKVERVHASSGSIMVAGAGRTAATPNLNEGKFFIGDSNNYSSIGSFNNQFINTNGTISLSNNIAISGELEGGSLDINGDGDISGNLSVSTAPTAGAHVTNKTYVDAQVAGIVDGAPSTLNTLNEIAASLNNNATLEATLTNSIGEKLVIANNLSDLENAGTARTNLGLGTAATTDATAYATAAQGTTADNALSASSVSTFGGTLIDDADAAAARTTLGLGTAATTASTAYAPAAGSSNIVTTGALNSGSITSGFTSIDIGSGDLTAGATTVNGNFIVNNDSMEVVSTDDGATAKPILSLYRNSPSPANNDRMGGIRFFGNNNADPVEKTFYAGIDALASNVTENGNVGSLRFYLADQSSTSSPITDVSANITDDEDPVMALYKHGLEMGPGNDIFLATQNDVLEWKDTGNYDQKLQGRQTETSGGNSVITMPDKETGVLAVTDAETFTGGMTVEGGLTSSPPIQTITGATTSVNTTDFLGYAGKRIMVTTTNAPTIDLPNSAAGDEGKTWVIMNASSNEITLDTDNNGTAQYFRILTGGSVITPNQGFGGVKHIKITKGGIAELVCLGDGNSLTAPSYVIFGSGVHYE